MKQNVTNETQNLKSILKGEFGWFKNDSTVLKNLISSYSISDDETKTTIKNVLAKENYLLDPHGAVAYIALKKYLENDNDSKGIFLETAHPVKFYDVVEPVIQQSVPIPESVQLQINKEKKSTKISADSKLVKDFLMGL